MIICQKMAYHKPVLLEESLFGLNIRPGGTYIDVTLGGGGHSSAILQKLGKKGRLLAFDQDIDAGANIPDDPRLTFIHANFRFLRNFLRYYAIDKADGILADLGISSHHIDSMERGFTYLKNTKLDMRMNVDSSLTASDILNHYPAEKLNRIFREYGEIPNATYLTSLIIRLRQEKKIKTSDEFISGINAFLPDKNRFSVLSRIFQALRIEVNDELGALKDFLCQVPEVLVSGGRIAIITYHSLEDRLVKNFFRSGNLLGGIEKDFFGNPVVPFKLITRNPIIPGNDEISGNIRARSAKLRIAEMI